MSKFEGYTPDLYNFFTELEKNNNKEWFDLNRKTYEKEVKLKSQHFVETMSEKFLLNGLNYIADKKKSLFRINRDIRFSKDKSPYKTNLGVYFPYSDVHMDVKDPKSIGLYIHFQNKECFIAGGLYAPDPKGLLAVRTRIFDEWPAFSKIVEDKKFREEFPVIEFNNSLKTTPKGFPKDHPSDKWLRKKDFTPLCYINHNTFYSSELPDFLVSKGKALMPFLEFLTFALDNY